MFNQTQQRGLFFPKGFKTWGELRRSQRQYMRQLSREGLLSYPIYKAFQEGVMQYG